MVLVVDLQQSTVGGHQFRGSKAACGRAVLARQPSDAAAEHVAGDPNRPGKAVERRESVRMRGGDDIAPLRACFRSRRAGRTRSARRIRCRGDGVMRTLVMPREVHEQRIVRGVRMSVSAALHCDRQIVLTREADRGRHVRGDRRHHDNGGTLIEGRDVPRLPRGVVAVIAGHEHAAVHAGPQGVKLSRRECGRSS